MQSELLPLFPLSVVLFPRVQLPLHIFEDRYKDMIGQAIQAKTEFGLVLSSEKGVAGTGCTAIVEKVIHRYPDGRLDIVAIGLRRFEILDLNTEKIFLQGSVTYFNDEETTGAASDARESAVASYQELRRFLSEESAAEPEWSDPQLSFQLAQLIPDLEFRQQLLVSRSEAERIEMLAAFLPAHIDQQRHVLHMKTVAPTNGHGPSSIVS